MNEEQRLRELAAVARREVPPTVDVADEVMARLRRRRQRAQAGAVAPLAWVAAGSAAAAVPLAVVAANTWQYLTSPLLGLFLEPAGGLL